MFEDIIGKDHKAKEDFKWIPDIDKPPGFIPLSVSKLYSMKPGDHIRLYVEDYNGNVTFDYVEVEILDIYDNSEITVRNHDDSKSWEILRGESISESSNEFDAGDEGIYRTYEV